MNEEQIMRVSILGSVIGIIALYFVSLNLAPMPVNIDEINNEFIGQFVIVRGTVSDVYFHEDGHIFFNLMSGETINEANKIKIVIWDEYVKQLELNHVNIREVENGNHLEIKGVIELYKGELEIVPLRANVKFI